MIWIFNLVSKLKDCYRKSLSSFALGGGRWGGVSGEEPSEEEEEVEWGMRKGTWFPFEELCIIWSGVSAAGACISFSASPEWGRLLIFCLLCPLFARGQERRRRDRNMSTLFNGNGFVLFAVSARMRGLRSMGLARRAVFPFSGPLAFRL